MVSGVDHQDASLFCWDDFVNHYVDETVVNQSLKRRAGIMAAAHGQYLRHFAVTYSLIQVDKELGCSERFGLLGGERRKADASEYSLFNYMESVIARLSQNGHHGTSRAYKSTLASFKKFRKEEDVMLDCITSELMEDYAAWLKSNGNIPNTASFYNRILKAVYIRAVEGGIIEDRHPFRKVYTGIDKTVKRALAIPLVKKIKDLDLSLKPKLAFARDMFILSFYLRGMSFIDMALLKKTDVKDKQLTYRRHKTGQLLTIA